MQPTIGHNSGATLTEQLAVENEKLLGQVDAFAKECDDIAKEIASAEDHEACVAAVKTVRRIAGTVEAAREERKKPFLQAGRDVDAFFGQMTTRLTRIKAVLEQRVQKYLAAQAEKQRREREEAARQAREEQERLLAEAAKAQAGQQDLQSDVLLGQAMVAEVEEKTNLAVAAGPISDLSRTRTAAGTTSLSEVWTFEIEDLSKIDLNQLRGQISEPDIRRYIARAVGLGLRQLDGVRIFQTSKVNIR